MSSFYSYWEHSKVERMEFLSRYREENLDVIPYWKADWHINFSGCDLRVQAPILDLIAWAKAKGRVLSFYIPLTPCPIVPEGGLPYKQKVGALDNRLMSLTVVEKEGRLNHLHSAFAPQTPNLFLQWINGLKELCDREQVGVHWWGLRSYYPHNVHFHSYIEDSSRSFEKAFSKFVKTNQITEEDNLLDEKSKFQYLFSEFYEASFEDALEDEAYKTKDLCFLKGSPESLFWQNLAHEDELNDISLDFCRSHTYGMKPNFSLVDKGKFAADTWRFFDEIAPLENDFREVYMESNRIKFQPLHLFRLWGEGSHSMIEEKANELKLTTFFFNFFRWTYLLENEYQFNEEQKEEIVFCLQESLSNQQVKDIAQAFSRGHKIIFFQESFNEKQWRFWNSFIEGNGYFKEEMLYQGKIHYYSNDQGGQVVIMSRLALSRLGVNPVVELWEKIIEFFNLDAFKIHHSDGVNYFWQTRDVRSHELSYKEVRRVFIHNTNTSKQRVHIKKIKNGSLVKVSERIRAKVSTDDEHVWVELDGLGMTSLEFGVIE